MQIQKVQIFLDAVHVVRVRGARGGNPRGEHLILQGGRVVAWAVQSHAFQQGGLGYKIVRWNNNER